MENGFTKGLIIGGLIAASLGMAINSDLMSARGRKKMMKSGRKFLRRTGSMMNGVVGVFK